MEKKESRLGAPSPAGSEVRDWIDRLFRDLPEQTRA